MVKTGIWKALTKPGLKNDQTITFIVQDSPVQFVYFPGSTFLSLISAFVSYPNTGERFINFKKSLMGKAYSEAIKEKYRFYSFGDTSLIL